MPRQVRGQWFDISLNCMYGMHIRKQRSWEAQETCVWQSIHSQSEAANQERVATHVRRFLHLHSSFLLIFECLSLANLETPCRVLCPCYCRKVTVEPRKVRWVDERQPAIQSQPPLLQRGATVVPGKHTTTWSQTRTGTTYAT